MLISKPQDKSSSDIELPVLTSHARSIQPPPQEHVLSSSSTSNTNPENGTTNPIVVPDGIEPPTYFPPSNDIPPIPSLDVGLLEYTRLHGHSEIPLSSRQREDDTTSVQASEAPAEALPAYRADNPPIYSHREPKNEEPSTWSLVCFKLGFLFPPFWLCGALVLVTPQGTIARIFDSWFQDFAPSADSWCHDGLQTEAEKEAYLRSVEIRWAKRCLFALSLLMAFVIAVAAVIIAVTKVQ